MKALRYHAINGIAGGVLGACVQPGWMWFIGMAAMVAVIINVASGVD